MLTNVNLVDEVVPLRNEIAQNRRWFHQYPELRLKSYGITEIYEGVATTGVVAVIRGGSGGPCIALRADMDALAVQESADIAYCSKNEGCMHACGHDGHMASLLGAAKVLFAERESLKGSVKLIFQPAEEGYGGAKVMISEGVLEEGALGPKVDAIYGIHLWTYEALGTIGCKEGPIMAASDKFSIDVLGKGGHGAAPQGTVDAIVEAAHLVTSLQTIVARVSPPPYPVHFTSTLEMNLS